MDMSRTFSGQGQELVRALAFALARQSRVGFDPVDLVSSAELLSLASDLGIEEREAGERANALHARLVSAVERLAPEPGRAARILLAFDERARGRPLGVRRVEAAKQLSLTAESFRKHREGRLLNEIARALVVDAAERKLTGPADSRPPEPGLRDRTKVMLIHGRDAEVRDAVGQFMHALGLVPVPWNALHEQTGMSRADVALAFRAALDIVQVAIVLLSPTDNDQPSANVLFEAGLAMGIAPSRTVLVSVGEVVLPSDLAGLNILRLTNTAASRNALRVRLAAAGCGVSTPGSEWLDPRQTGSFEATETDRVTQDAGSAPPDAASPDPPGL